MSDAASTASGLSVFFALLYYVYKYYIITAIIDYGNIKKEWGKHVKAFCALIAIFTVYAAIMIAAVSICTSYIPELSAWTSELLAGNTESVQEFFKQLEGVNYINALVFSVILLVVVGYSYFCVLTSAVMIFRTNRFYFSMLAPFGFINRNFRIYALVLFPGLIFSFVLMYFVVDLSWLITLFYAYSISLMFDTTFIIDNKKHS